MKDSRSSWLPRILTHVVWTPLEKRFKNLNAKCKPTVTLTLKNSLEERFRRSTLGVFLYHLNSVQLQDISVQEDKLEAVLYDLARKTEDIRKFQRRNDICEDVICLVQESLLGNPTGTINLRDVLNRLRVLRLAASKISVMDNSLAELAALEALILSGNHLDDFPGKYLPRTLNHLELFCNCFTDLAELLTDPPPDLLYLGLSRNYISQGCLEQLSRLKNLCYLDLEDNNIQSLTQVTMVLAQLRSLTSLVLQGNPCSMCEGYKFVIISSAQQLLFLDRVELTTLDKHFDDNIEYQVSGTLQIFGIRIIGIPKPVAEKFNGKKVKHTFHLEAECPLLDAQLKRWDNVIIEEHLVNNEPVTEMNKKLPNKKSKADEGTNKNRLKDKSKGNKSKDSKSVKKSKQLTSQETNESEDIFNQMIAEDKLILGACDIFKSERIEWQNILQFSEPSIEIPVENADLDLLRDVFRTVLTIRLIHMKTVPPDKKTNSKTKDKKKGKESIEVINTSMVNEPTEIIISRTLLAKINIPLQSIGWNEKSLDYSWDKSKPLLAKLTPNVRMLQYTMKTNKGKKTKENKLNEADEQEIPLPTILTCHVGVGLKRT